MSRDAKRVQIDKPQVARSVFCGPGAAAIVAVETRKDATVVHVVDDSSDGKP